MPPHLVGLTGATLPTTPAVCHDCAWWQARAGRSASKDRWIERVEDPRMVVRHAYWRDAALHQAIPYRDYMRHAELLTAS